MEFIINGHKTGAAYAAVRFAQYHRNVNHLDASEIVLMWNQCKLSEEARDMWLPDNLEIIA